MNRKKIVAYGVGTLIAVVVVFGAWALLTPVEN